MAKDEKVSAEEIVRDVRRQIRKNTVGRRRSASCWKDCAARTVSGSVQPT